MVSVNNYHLFTETEGNSEFCGAETAVVARSEAEGNNERSRGHKTHSLIKQTTFLFSRERKRRLSNESRNSILMTYLPETRRKLPYNLLHVCIKFIFQDGGREAFIKGYIRGSCANSLPKF